MITIEDIIGTMKNADLSTVPEDLKPDAPLVAQGFDSLDVATLMLALETKYKKAIPIEKMGRLRTLQDIAAFLNA